MKLDPYQTRCCTLIVMWLVASGCSTLSDREAELMEQAAAKGSPFVGLMAPSFNIVNQANEPVSIQQYLGQWVVLYFYPEDDTPGCTCQATEFTRLIGHFAKLDSIVLGVSPNTPQSHRKFRQGYGIAITLLSDLDHEVARAYGAWNQMGWKNQRIGRIIRSTVLIDPEGRIAYHWPEVLPKGHANRVRRQLVDLQTVWNH